MPVWRCPHCSTPQAEASRCWVCRRSTTSCATCRHFRRGVAGGLGLCGLDRKRLALTGTEMRPCWVAAVPPVDVEVRWTGSTHIRVPGDAVGRTAATTSMTVAALAGGGGPASLEARAASLEARAASLEARAASLEARATRRPRTFVPVDDPEMEPAAPAEGGDRPHVPTPVTRVPGTWWLWGDPEPWPEG